MHEYGLAETLLAVALEVAESHGRQPVEQLWVRLGRLRQVMPEALSFAFSAVAHGTLAEGATLHWENDWRVRHTKASEAKPRQHIVASFGRCASPALDAHLARRRDDQTIDVLL